MEPNISIGTLKVYNHKSKILTRKENAKTRKKSAKELISIKY